jgi:hypothetical protein
MFRPNHNRRPLPPLAGLASRPAGPVTITKPKVRLSGQRKFLPGERNSSKLRR